LYITAQDELVILIKKKLSTCKKNYISPNFVTSA